MKQPKVKPRKFECGTFYQIINDTLTRAGIEYKLVSGFAFQPKYRVGKKKLTLPELVALANVQRSKEGRALLSVPGKPYAHKPKRYGVPL